MRFSRGLAYVGGVVLPIVEMARRWQQLGDLKMAPAWLDDWVIGVFLLYAAWRSSRDEVSGRPILIAAWGFACGMGVSSLVSALTNLDQADPSGFASVTVALVKGLMLGLGFGALSAAIRATPSRA